MEEEEHDPSIERLWEKIDACEDHAKIELYLELHEQLNIAERYVSALAVADAAYDLEMRLHEGISHYHFGDPLFAGAFSLMHMGEEADAIERFQLGLSHQEFAPIHEFILRYYTLSEWLRDADRNDEAFEMKLRLKDAYSSEGNAFQVGRTLEDLAEWYYADGRYAEGLAAASEALEIFKKFRHWLNLATAESVMGACLSQLGEIEAGLKATSRSWAAIRTMYGEDKASIHSLYYLGISEIRAGRLEEASQTLVWAKRSLDLSPSMGNLDLKLSVERELSEVLKVLGKEEEAIEIDRRHQEVLDARKFWQI